MWIADLFSIRTSHQTQYESIVAEYKTAIEGNEKIVARLRSQRDQMQVEFPEHLPVVHGGRDNFHRDILGGEFLVIGQGGGHGRDEAAEDERVARAARPRAGMAYICFVPSYFPWFASDG